MKLTVHEIEVDCPDSHHMVSLVKSLSFTQVRQIQHYQREPKLWPCHGNIPTYCLYLGSKVIDGEKYDFYHYESGPNSYPHYSTAIVYGDTAGDYMSGWPECAKADGNHEHYREFMRREYRCGLLTVDDLVRIGVMALGVAYGESDAIRPMRSNFRLQPKEDWLEDYYSPRFDLWEEIA